MTYVERYGDLLNAPAEYVIAHNIDAGETAMGAGVALALCRKHPSLRAACQYYSEQNKGCVGHTFRFDSGQRVVYNMYTKPHVWCNAYHGMIYSDYLKNQEKCFLNLRNQMELHGETKLAIPRVGSGLDRCKWEDIRLILHRVFEGSNIDIIVFCL